LLAEALGGPFFLAFVSAVAFATIVAVVAGLVIAASGAFAHDFYTNVIRGGEVTEHEQFRAARYTSLGISVGAIILALLLQGQNVAFLVALAFAVAASANVPVLLLLIFWRGFNTAGAVTGMLTGLISSVGLVALSPVALGDSAIFPLDAPAIISVPLGFIGCLLGTKLGGKAAEREMEEGTQIDYDEIYVRANTGISNIEEELKEAEQSTQTT
ncbi:MAG TPA: cation acetate symporter, partial [Rubrobacteraceae bacterium]|nr:cation acetate symporter [Rubrobacteraceae bacterium]